jgi:hypothetical protein
MATWEYGELIAESVSISDEGEWVTQTALTWYAPKGGSKAVQGSIVYALNRLGSNGWEVVGLTRNQIQDKFQIRAVTTYVLKRQVRKRLRHDVGEPVA